MVSIDKEWVFEKARGYVDLAVKPMHSGRSTTPHANAFREFMGRSTHSSQTMTKFGHFEQMAWLILRALQS